MRRIEVMNETVLPTVVEHDTLALIVTTAAVAFLMTLSSASGGLSAALTRFVVAAVSGA